MMARKTVIKRGSKYVPQSPELTRALSLDDGYETGDAQNLGAEVLDGVEVTVEEREEGSDDDDVERRLR